MSTLEKLQQKLEDPEFFKRHIPNILFIFSSWKKDFQRYQEADRRRIVTNHLLRRSEHEDFFYNTYAISTTGDIDASQVDRLRHIAQQLELGEIRYMAHATNGFHPLVDENGEIVDAPDIKLGVSDVYLFTLSDTDPAKIDCPYSVIIWKGRELKKWPLSRKVVDEI